MTVDIAAFWKPFEATAGSFEEVQQHIHDLFDRWSAEGRMFAWRGHSDADYPLHSSLYRHVVSASPAASAPVEKDLADAEHRLLVDFHRWGLHMGEFGRLSVMAQLAILQHYGAPTRLIDVTFNPWIGLWFAVEEKWKEGEPRKDIDVRLFAIDVTNRLINELDAYRGWEDATNRPWPEAAGSKADDEKKAAYKDWVTQVLVGDPHISTHGWQHRMEALSSAVFLPPGQCSGRRRLSGPRVSGPSTRCGRSLRSRSESTSSALGVAALRRAQSSRYGSRPTRLLQSGNACGCYSDIDIPPSIRTTSASPRMPGACRRHCEALPENASGCGAHHNLGQRYGRLCNQCCIVRNQDSESRTSSRFRHTSPRQDARLFERHALGICV